MEKPRAAGGPYYVEMPGRKRLLARSSLASDAASRRQSQLHALIHRNVSLTPTAHASCSELIFFSFPYRPTEHDYGVACKHGPSECLGNIIELCAASLYPDPKLYLGFTMCLARNYEEIPQRSLVEDCALEHGLSFDMLNACASNEDGAGMSLLRASVQRSAEANVQISCTVRLDEKVRCVRDNGEWKDCDAGYKVEDLVEDVNKLYESMNLGL